MKKRKTLQDLTIKDNFLFGAVMQVEENCRGSLRWYWDFPFVIFLCDFDPFNQKLYCYTFKSECKEDKSVELDDGCHTIFLSTKGKNSADVSPELVRFLRFVTAEGAGTIENAT